MARGGFREGAGRKSGWKNAETSTIRVPVVLAERLIEIAHVLDAGGAIDIVTESENRNDSVIKSSNNVTKSNDVCPHCGFDAWTIQGYRTLKSGQRNQRRRCKQCDRGWSVAIG